VVDIGTGAKSTMAMIGAEALGIPPDRIQLASGDTDVTPYSIGERAAAPRAHRHGASSPHRRRPETDPPSPRPSSPPRSGDLTQGRHRLRQVRPCPEAAVAKLGTRRRVGNHRRATPTRPARGHRRQGVPAHLRGAKWTSPAT
jgi:hypothetical protein